MILFIRKIPANTHVSEINEFLRPALRAGLFKKPGRILNTEILKLHALDTVGHEYHGLVTLDTDATGQRALKKLRGQRFKGKFVIVREYVIRHWQNDPRHNKTHLPPEVFEKRKAERRRNSNRLEKVVDITHRISSLGDFARKY